MLLSSEKSLIKMLLLEVLAEKLFWVNIYQILTNLELDARVLLHEHFVYIRFHLQIMLTRNKRMLRLLAIRVYPYSATIYDQYVKSSLLGF